MTAAFAAVLIGSGLLYALIISGFASGFQRVIRADPSKKGSADVPFVSVLIPARDEADGITRCLDAVLANDYPEDRFEVIVIDDLSQDATAGLVHRVMERVNRSLVPAGFEEEEGEEPLRLRLVSMPENLDRAQAHKKRAIEKGIALAQGEIILTTDADCAVPPGWIRTMAATFDEETALVSGPVLYPTGSGSENVMALEFLGLVAVGAGAIGINRPNLCNGANVAYRKAVFDALGGFSGIDHLTSGDDEMLMQKIAYTTRWQIRFCANPDAAVLTDAPDGAAAFFEQRRRWASKGAHYEHPAVLAVVGTVYVFYLALLAGVLALPFVPGLGVPLIVGTVLKLLPEAALLGPACRHVGRGRLMAYFLPAQLLHVPYIVFMGAVGAFGGYTWKGRRIIR